MRINMIIKTYKPETIENPIFVVVLSKYNGKILLSRHKKRTTWETQGGHIEDGETPLEAAKRELYEESGATEYDIKWICDYTAGEDSMIGGGCVFMAEIKTLGPIPNSEMAEVKEFDALPENLTYPEITPVLFAQIGCYRYKKATPDDIDELVRTRSIVLRAANKLTDDIDMSTIEKESYEYYTRAIESGEHTAYLVYDGDKFIGAGGVSYYQIMPTYHNPSGKKAYIMNMYTSPEYRRKRIAMKTLDLLVKDARKKGITQIYLEATEMGRGLYEKYGFVQMMDEMELKNNEL